MNESRRQIPTGKGADRDELRTRPDGAGSNVVKQHRQKGVGTFTGSFASVKIQNEAATNRKSQNALNECTRKVTASPDRFHATVTGGCTEELSVHRSQQVIYVFQVFVLPGVCFSLLSTGWTTAIS